MSQISSSLKLGPQAGIPVNRMPFLVTQNSSRSSMSSASAPKVGACGLNPTAIGSAVRPIGVWHVTHCWR